MGPVPVRSYLATDPGNAIEFGECDVAYAEPADSGWRLPVAEMRADPERE